MFGCACQNIPFSYLAVFFLLLIVRLTELFALQIRYFILSGSFHVLLRNLLYGLVWSNLRRRIQFLVLVAWNVPERQAIEANMLGGLEWRFVVSNSLRTWFTTSNPSQLSEAVNWQDFGHFWARVSYLYSLYTQGLVSSNFVCFESFVYDRYNLTNIVFVSLL